MCVILSILPPQFILFFNFTTIQEKMLKFLKRNFGFGEALKEESNGCSMPAIDSCTKEK